MLRLLTGLALGLTSCCFPAGAEETGPGALPRGAELVLADDFARADLGPDWLPKAGAWQIENGSLRGTGPDAFLVCGKEPGVNLRLEYTAWSEDPGDLSACLGIGTQDRSIAGLLFQFGGAYNKLTRILNRNTGGDLFEAKDVPIVKGRRHRVVCERWGNLVRFLIDGKLLFAGFDPSPEKVQGKTVGFYIYTQGCIDDVRLYRLAGEPSKEVLPVEPEPAVSAWLNFNDLGKQEWPEGFTVQCGAGGTARTLNQRDYEDGPAGPKWVDDGCLELCSASAAVQEQTVASYSFKPLSNGMIEMELLCYPEGGGNEGRLAVSLCAAEMDAPVATLTTDERGQFIIRGADGAVTELVNRITYPHMRRTARYYFAAGRWFRIRIHFDTTKGTFSVAVVGMYASAMCQRPWKPGIQFPYLPADWFELGKDLPLAGRAGTKGVTGIRLATAGKGRLLVDNLYVHGPVNGLTVRNRSCRLPAALLLDTKEHFRHDPIDIALFSLRSPNSFPLFPRPTGPLVAGKYPAIQSAAQAYNEILVRQAFLEVEGRKLARGEGYIEASGKPMSPELRDRLVGLQNAVKESGVALGELYRVLLGVYLDGFNEARVAQEFEPQAERLREMLGRTTPAIKQWLADAGAGTMVPDPAPSAAPKDRVPRQGRITADSRPCFFFAQNGTCFYPEQERLLGMDDCLSIPHSWVNAPQGQYFNSESFGKSRDTIRAQFPDRRLYVVHAPGRHYCYSSPPPWWLEQNQADDDVFLCDEEGRIPTHEGKRWEGGKAQLNFWNVKVQEMLRTQTLELAASLDKLLPGGTAAFELMAEAYNAPAEFRTGYNASARAAFREKMRGTYGAIAALNERWGTQYAAFEAIEPPPDFGKVPRIRPTGLGYEWELFRQEGYRAWMRLVIKALKEKLPDVPVGTRIGGMGGDDARAGFDWSLIYPEFDLFEFHTAAGEPDRLPSRTLSSLARALGGQGALVEWVPMASAELFDEVEARRIGEIEFFGMAADGRSFFTVWYGVCPGWCDEGYWSDPRWLHATLRYSTTAIPVSVARLRQFERPLLDYPLVTPRVNILESNASFLNGYPTHTLRAKAFMFSKYLEKNGWDYGMLWERLVLNGKQNLDGTDVILLPNATSMPTEMQVRLRDWVQAGGTLIAVGAAGVHDPWGRPEGTLLKAAFGEGNWKYDARVWVPEKDPTESKVGTYPPRGTVYRASLGKGTVVLFSQVYNEAEPEEQILKYVAAGAKERAFYGVGAKFALTLREDKAGNRWFLTALNANAFDSAADEIRFRGPQVTVRDLELPGIAIPARREGEETVFRLQLAPGEGIVLELAAAPR